jgi:hypothetical protein
MGRCRRDVVSSPRLRFSPLEVFTQRFFQPIPPCIFFRQVAFLARGFIPVIRHSWIRSNASRLNQGRYDARIYSVSRSPIVQSPIPGRAKFEVMIRPIKALPALADEIGNRIGPQLSQRKATAGLRR